MRSCFYKWYRGQVVRQESAKLSFASSNLAGTSNEIRTHPGSDFSYVRTDMQIKIQYA